MNILEKLGITKGPWSLSGSYNQLVVHGDGESTRDVLFESWKSHAKKENTPDTIMVSASPEMLEALIIITKNIEDQTGGGFCLSVKVARKNNINIIEKAAGKKWSEIKALLNE